MRVEVGTLQGQKARVRDKVLDKGHVRAVESKACGKGAVCARGTLGKGAGGRRWHVAQRWHAQTGCAVRLASKFGSLLGGHGLVVANSFRHGCFLGSSLSFLFLFDIIRPSWFFKTVKFFS